jgi:hypothetical protein
MKGGRRRAARAKRAGEVASAPSPQKPARRPGRQLEDVREADPDGRIVVHDRTLDPLGRMLRSGTIDQAMHDAGRDFQTAFVSARLDPLRANSMLRVPGMRGEHHLGERLLDARHRVHSAMAALGGHASPAASCIWFVLGHQMSLHQWALRQRWGGRAVRPDQAMGVLVAALAVLAAHDGHGSDEPCAS